MNRHLDVLRWLEAGDVSEDRAWPSNLSSRDGLERVEVLKEPNDKSAVFRLYTRGLGDPIVAKWGRTEAIELDRLMHGDLLPRLGVASLHLYGHQIDRGSGGAWLFMEDAGGQPLDLANPAHVHLASTWLATLHTRSAMLSEVPDMPRRGSAHILQSLRQARCALDGEAARAARGQGFLEVLVETLTTLEAHWDAWAAAPDDIPNSVSHNDFVTKNVRVVQRGASLALIALDWEHSGWGVPLADLEAVDPRSYVDTAQAAGNALAVRSVRLGQLVGRIYRLVEAISWACAYLSTPFPQKAFERYLPYYQQRLSAAIAAVEGLTR